MKDIAILPIGSYEWHGEHLPFNTDCLIAEAISQGISDANLYTNMVLPTIGISCSHEHRDSISLRPETLVGLVRETVAAVLENQAAGVVVLVNAQTGNHGLYSLAQELNRGIPKILLFPRKHNWSKAASVAGVEGGVYDDVHAGEIESSILLSVRPDLVNLERAWDETKAERPLMHVLGMDGYTKNGVLGRPSLATADKGKTILKSLANQANSELQTLFDRCETHVPSQAWSARR
ncbi:MAG: creatininase family protein [Patescibacteria group bacterium]